jgi:hypothetical protein
MGSVLVALNGLEVWAFVVELEDGLRVRFEIDDWNRLNLDLGNRVPVRLPGRADVWLFVTNVTELPPIVWVMLAKRVRVAG